MTEVSERATAINAVRSALDGARLIWSGIRGEDAEALSALPEFKGSLSIIAPIRDPASPLELNVSLEELRGSRPDLDRYDIDLDPSDAAAEFRRLMRLAVRDRCVVMTYRPSALVSALAFSMAETMTLAGPLGVRQAAFEHKPWVECSLQALGVRGLGWHYVADQHRSEAKRMVASGPHVLRASHTSGGVGIALVRAPEDVDRCWPEQPDAFVAVAPFQAGVPINFSGCVFADGSVSLHPASVQLIGVESCTDRQFGYCGNDFGALTDLCGERALLGLDELGRTIGHWLHREGFRGVFGVDAIVDGDLVVFAEVNPRFQGSSVLSALVASELETPDLFLDHLAATLGRAPSGRGLTIGEWAYLQPALSRVVVHNTSDTPVSLGSAGVLEALPGGVKVGQLAIGLPVDPGGALCCATIPRSVTASGFELDGETQHLACSLRDLFSSSGPRA